MSNSGKKAITQGRILSAAAGLFMERGYESTSISAIAERAGVSRSAIFWHFGDKGSLFHQVCSDLLQPFIDQIDAPDRGVEPRKLVIELLAVYEDFAAAHRETIRTFVRWMLESPEEAAGPRRVLLDLHERFVRKLACAVERSATDRGEALAIAGGFASLLDGNLLLALLDDDFQTAEQRAARLRAVVEFALRD